MLAWPALILLGEIIGYALTGDASVGRNAAAWCGCISTVLVWLGWLVFLLSEGRELWFVVAPLVGLMSSCVILGHYCLIAGAPMPTLASVRLMLGVTTGLAMSAWVAIKILDLRQREQRGGKHCES